MGIARKAKGGFTGLQVITASGNFTVPAGVFKLKVTVVGGGGNGASASGAFNGGGTAGGGAGGVAIKYIDVLPLQVIAVTVGGVASASSFGAYCSATGGASAAQDAIVGGAGGIGSGGDININGANGKPASGAVSGNGADSPFGAGAQGRATVGAGLAAVGYGAGGGGAVDVSNISAYAAGAGVQGVVIVEY